MNKIGEIENFVDGLYINKSSKKKMAKRTKLIGVGFVLFLAVTLGSAGLLAIFGQMNVIANVKQSVVWDGDGNWHEYDDPIEITIEEIYGGCSYAGKTKIWNRGCSGGWLDLTDYVEEGVTVSHWILPGELTLILDNKNPETWEPIQDDYLIELTFNPICPQFDWCLKGRVPLPSTGYVLIYYADQPDRFVNWGGAPALELGIVTSDAYGDIDTCGSADVTSFPFEDDWNIGPDADYSGDPDYYCHAKGAKIWLIPTSDYDGVDNVLNTWDPTNYMFETDLVIYFDCDELPIPWIAKTYFEYACEVDTFPYWIESGEKISLIYHFGFDWAIIPGTYTMTMELVPAPTP